MNIPAMTLADRSLYLITFVSLPILFWSLWQTTGQALHADIHVNGEYQQRVSLQQDRTLLVHGELGDSLLEIKNGKIRFKDSPCTIKRCVHSGWLKQSGEFNACVPNQVSIALLGSDSHPGISQFDSINF